MLARRPSSNRLRPQRQLARQIEAACRPQRRAPPARSAVVDRDDLQRGPRLRRPAGSAAAAPRAGPGTRCAGSRAAPPDRPAPPPARARSSAPVSRTASGIVIGARCGALQPLQEPQPPLRIGQRDLGRPRLRAQAAARSAALRVDSRRRQRRHARRLEQAADRDLDIEHGADPADQPRRQQRVPAELEEVVVDADPRQPQHLGEQLAQDRLLRRRAARGAAARRQAPAPAAPGGRACRSASAASRSSTTSAAGTM